MPSLRPDGRRMCGRGSKWIRPKRRLAIYERDGWRCFWCGEQVHRFMPPGHPRQATLDHVIPKRFGIGHADHLLATACFEHNSARNTYPRKRDLLVTRAGRRPGHVLP